MEQLRGQTKPAKTLLFLFFSLTSRYKKAFSTLPVLSLHRIGKVKALPTPTSIDGNGILENFLFVYQNEYKYKY